MTKFPTFISVNSLRHLSGTALQSMDRPALVMSHNQPIAAVIPYDVYLTVREWVHRAQEAEKA
jgi:hypothetical protein